MNNKISIISLSALVALIGSSSWGAAESDKDMAQRLYDEQMAQRLYLEELIGSSSWGAAESDEEMAQRLDEQMAQRLYLEELIRLFTQQKVEAPGEAQGIPKEEKETRKRK